MVLKKKRRRRGHGGGTHRGWGAWKPFPTTCPGCSESIDNVMGAHLDKQGRHWHPDCYTSRDRGRWRDA